ncbi:hypothetical protein QQF64_010738 [Cirrhinus molitorella]|uniref:NACHT domain-containing protein n=1 Tax=Cirrhinus molitorella TaxID=172907 RepID=A0ABR3LX90_9TELE
MSLCMKREEEENVHMLKSPEPSCVSIKSNESIGIPPNLSDGTVTLYSEVKRNDVIRPVMSHLFCTYSDCKTLIRTHNTEALQKVKDQHRTGMNNKYKRLFEGIKLEENQTLLNRIYTQLYITEGESEGVNKQHEVLQLEKTPRTQDTPIYCNDIFKPLHKPGCDEKDKIKIVLTKGIAGIGKTVSVQKFILDWTEGKANQNVDFMFVLPFRELNLIKDHQYSLHRLLLDFHPELQDLDSKIYEDCEVVLIFDGLDESRITLMFSDIEKICDVNESSKVFCFIHLSFQEFLAAFFVFYSCVVTNNKLLKLFLNERYQWKNTLHEVLKAAVDTSLQSENGHLDLFLRFLLGISLESNQRLLQDLLTHTVNSSKTIKRITQYIKDTIKGGEHLSADRCINIFLCLLEMKDQTLYREIQAFVKSENHSVNQLTSAHCSTIAYMLQISEEVQDEFDLKKYNISDEVYIHILGGFFTTDESKAKCLIYCAPADLQHNSHQPVDVVLQKVRDQHKTSMKNKYESLFKKIKLEEYQTPLNWIYTQLYIKGGSEGVNEEREVLQMEKTARTQDTPIYCNDIFKPLHESDKIKTVLTKGIAGIGKTVSVQKFILDWTEGKANQDVDFMFELPFRELNLIKDHQYSLHRLLLDFHPELQDLDSKIYEECKVVLIFDGLDESRITLMFSDDEKVCDVNESSSVGVLMSSLIRGELLPSALIWITSRPATANQIPSKYINCVTEIQGFTEPQKEEYFRKKISDELQANRIISHIRRSRSLHIMCHIPVFCWISATVLQNLLKQNDSAEIPQTLTEMYIHFLLTQINIRNEKYDETDPEKILKSNRRVIVKLAELAFNQLMRGNVVFYEDDLRENGIDVTDASVYSLIFKEESVIHQRKVYSFIHLSFQHFLAAFSVFYSNVVKNKESLKLCLDGCNWNIWECSLLPEILKAAADKSLQSKNGHLDFFLQFLLGVSLESSQRLFKDLLTNTVNSSKTIERITQYIQFKIKSDECHSADRCINLFLCLLEMKDQTLYREIQEFVKSENCLENKLSPSLCSTIAYMLQISEEVLDKFDLRKYNTSDEGKRRLLPAVLNCRKAILADCNLSDHSCECLSSSLQSSNSLRELDLSYNYLHDSGVKLLSDGLKSSHCQLNILRLTSCKLTGQCCESLSSSLQSSNSLRELDLSNNDLQDLGVKLLSDGLKSSHCQLIILSIACKMSVYEKREENDWWSSDHLTQILPIN